MNSNKGYHAKIVCPVSAGVLEDMYWQKGMSLDDIAVKVYSMGLIDRIVSYGTVKKWCHELGVPTANHKQGGRRSAATKIAKYGSIGATLRGRTWNLSPEQRKKQSAALKGKKLGRQTPEQLGHPLIECACCMSKFHRQVSGIRQSFRRRTVGVFFYCSKDCQNKGARFKDTIHAEVAYLKTDWYLSLLSRIGVNEEANP